MQRLKTRPQFQAVLAGSVIAKTEHFVLHCNGLDTTAPKAEPGPERRPDGAKELSSRKNIPDNGTAAPADISVQGLFPVQDIWIGAMVPKRWAKRAVTRNAIKRQIYNVSADSMQNYPQAAFLVRLRREFSRKEFLSATSTQLKEAVRHEVQALMKAGVAST
ncbi:MAG: ribonuclease P protein component [Polaromonas sp.]|uniref:ribonuclease P protein component n=1 Tax=Polaromonas sp. TaxID=1869339 RepID=UPI0025F92B83|nr:ribonuclease P protein component [Polaromonas sp.]MBI2727648.1 ribonuclease P protein component [Polaromonas sp.]